MSLLILFCSFLLCSNSRSHVSSNMWWHKAALVSFCCASCCIGWFDAFDLERSECNVILSPVCEDDSAESTQKNIHVVQFYLFGLQTGLNNIKYRIKHKYNLSGDKSTKRQTQFGFIKLCLLNVIFKHFFSIHYNKINHQDHKWRLIAVCYCCQTNVPVPANTIFSCRTKLCNYTISLVA